MFEFTLCDCLKAASEQHFSLLFLTSVIMFGPTPSRTQAPPSINWPLLSLLKQMNVLKTMDSSLRLKTYFWRELLETLLLSIECKYCHFC